MSDGNKEVGVKQDPAQYGTLKPQILFYYKFNHQKTLFICCYLCYQ